MNWFKKQEAKKPMVKTAAVLNRRAALDWKNQEGEWMTFGDVNRYVMDAYSIKIYLSKTERGWTISLMTNHAYLGTAQYCVFWRFNEDEEKQARSVYKQVNSVIKDTVKEFVSGEKPTSLFDPTLRFRIQNIEDADLVRTNIPIINYSYRIDYEPDWDRNIYGPRYPDYREVSFNQYLNSSIYSKPNPPTGKFAL